MELLPSQVELAHPGKSCFVSASCFSPGSVGDAVRAPGVLVASQDPPHLLRVRVKSLMSHPCKSGLPCAFKSGSATCMAPKNSCHVPSSLAVPPAWHPRIHQWSTACAPPVVHCREHHLVRGSGAKPVNVQAMVDLEEALNVQAHVGDAAHDNNAAHLEHILFASKEVQLYDRVFARTERQRWKA